MKINSIVDMTITQQKYSLFALFFCLILGFFIYYNSLDVPFYLDDLRNFIENPYTRIDQLTISSLTDAAFKSPISTRPLSNISFALNYYFHQESVLGYHLVNVIIHIITGFLVYQLTVVTLSTPALESKYQNINHIALLASVLWLVHPLHTQSVTYIVQRMNSMATMFYILSLWCYVNGRFAKDFSRKWPWFSGSFVSAVLAIGSKEISVTLPLIMISYEWYFFRDLNRKWLISKTWILLIFVTFIGTLYCFYIGNPMGLFSGYENRPFSMSERILTEFRVVLYYLSLLFFPHPSRLNLDHDFVISTSLFAPVTTFISFSVVLIFILIIFSSAKKYRLFSFAILWYYVNLFIESSFIGLEIIFEHRTYLSSVFLFILLTTSLHHYIRKPWLSAIILITCIVICSLWTIKRNQIWKDPVIFWNDSVVKSPNKARPYINLSVAYRDIGDFNKSIDMAKKAIRIDPRFVNSFVSLGATYYAIGDYDEAIELYQLVLSKKSDYYDMYNALGNVYLKQGKMNEAIEAFRTNLQFDPANYESLVNLASIKAYKGLVHEAIIDFQKAVELSGKKPDVLFNLAVAYTQVGNNLKAIEAYREILNIRPDDKQAQLNLQELLEKEFPRN